VPVSAWCVRSHRRLLHWRAIGWTPHGRGGLWSLVSNTTQWNLALFRHFTSIHLHLWHERPQGWRFVGPVEMFEAKVARPPKCAKSRWRRQQRVGYGVAVLRLYCRIVLHSFWGSYNFGQYPNDLASPCKLGIAWLTGGDSSYHRLGQDRDCLCTLPASVRWFLWGAGNWESRSKEHADVRCLSVTFPFLVVGQAIFGFWPSTTWLHERWFIWTPVKLLYAKLWWF